MDILGFAVVGLGMGRNRARIIKDTAGAALRVVVDLNAELARETALELECDWTSELATALDRKDVQVVMVMTPSGHHAKIGVQAAKAGKHVISTKPMDVTTEACDALIDAADQAGVLLGVDYESRYVAANYRLAKAIERGWLGKLLLGEARFKWFRAEEYYKHNQSWRGTWAMDGGGSLANQGSHLLDLLLWYMGDPVRVYAETAVMNHAIETEDIGLVILNFANGAKGTILGTTTFPARGYFGTEVHGTEGAVLTHEALKGTWTVFGDGLEERLLTIENPYRNVIENMVAAVREGVPLYIDGSEGRRTVALLETIYRSSREGRAVET